MSFQFMYPLVGRLDRNRRTLGLVRISIHAPLAGCDTPDNIRGTPLPLNFNPRTPCGVRPGYSRMLEFNEFISIHAPLAGCDNNMRLQVVAPTIFQSTHPLRGATRLFLFHRFDDSISIHAPLAGCDKKRGWPLPSMKRFQSTHPLRGATYVYL